jgi:pimeloyl-ACP methyl ester carboxylesterase
MMKLRTLSGDPADRSGEVTLYRTEQRRAELMAIYDAKLRDWPVPFETLHVSTRYGRTHVIASGDEQAPPLVLLHPAGVAGFVWSALMPALSACRRVYALDTIGDLGRSELAHPDRYPKRGRDYSPWLDDVYRQLDVDAADVVAASMGGWIALNHAIVAPRRVSRLVLLGPMGLPSWRATLAIVVPITSLALRPTNAKLDALIVRALGTGERVTREMLGWMRLAGGCRPRTGKPLRVPDRMLRTIQVPTLVFLGGHDGAIGSAAAAASRARRTIPGSETVFLPDAGHLMMIDEPDQVGARIAEFLTGDA